MTMTRAERALNQTVIELSATLTRLERLESRLEKSVRKARRKSGPMGFIDWTNGSYGQPEEFEVETPEWIGNPAEPEEDQDHEDQ